MAERSLRLHDPEYSTEHLICHSDSPTPNYSKTYEQFNLGNKELPIFDYKDKIISAILDNDIVVIRAETGAGKSTQVPQYLLEAGFSKIVITQPRIVAAGSLSERIASELSTNLPYLPNDFVGYKTANEGNSTPDTVIEVVTDGLQVMRELNDNGVCDSEVLIIDEVHEWNTNISMLTALAKRNGIKTVVMSATINTENLAEYLGENSDKPAPILEIPGRAYEVTEETGDSLVDIAASYSRQHKNILIFVPGKPDIEKVKGKLRKKIDRNVTIVPLEGEQTILEQQLAFEHYAAGKIIIATDIAKTSITIDDIDVVIDCGWERSGTTRQDVPLLNIEPASKSTQDQRKGRVGRVKPGIYIKAPLDDYPELPVASEVAQYDTPDILKNRLDSIMLKLLGNAAISLDELDLMHQPEEQLTHYAKQRLQRLGAIAINGEVTNIGIEMAKLPVDAHYARMIIESLKFEPRIQVMMIAAIAAHADTTITHTSADADLTYGKLTDEQNSELLMMLDIFIEAQSMSIKELEQHGIVVKKLNRAMKSYTSLLERLGLEGEPLELPNAEDEEALLHCIITGADELYVPVNRFRHLDPRGYMRFVGKNSPLRGSRTTIIGNPFDIANMGKYGKTYKSLIKGATRVTTQQLIDTLPERCSFVEVGIVIRPDGEILSKKEVCFDGISTNDYITDALEISIDNVYDIVDMIINDNLPKINIPKILATRQTIDAVYDLVSRTEENLAEDDILDKIIAIVVASVPQQFKSLQEIDECLPDIKIADFIDTQKVCKILEATPDFFELDGEKIAIIYKKGKAYITLPSHVAIDSVLEATDIEESMLYLRYRNDARRYRTVEDLRARLNRSPRLSRRSANRPNKKDDVSYLSMVKEADIAPIQFVPQLPNMNSRNIKQYTQSRK